MAVDRPAGLVHDGIFTDERHGFSLPVLEGWVADAGPESGLMRVAMVHVATNTRVEFSFEGRYPNQVWEIEVPLSNLDFKSPEALKALINSFHKRHTELYSFRDDGDLIEIMSFRARAHISSRNETVVRMAGKSTLSTGNSKRKIFVKGQGFVTVDIYRIENIESSKKISGPVIIESGYTTVVVPEGASIARKEAGYLTMEL